MNGYFDYNATAPMLPAAREAWIETSGKNWHNPSSLYREAGEARHLLEHYREELADALGLDEPERVLFTGGATEANNAVIRFLAEETERAVAVSSIEHPAVYAPAQACLKGDRFREIPVNPDTGTVDLEILAGWLQTGELGAVSVMAANNETGAIQPWKKISELCRDAGVPFHTDAAQWFGKMPIGDLSESGFVTGSGHKFGGGNGTGFLVLPDDEFGDQFHGQVGGPQEEGKRAGTENLPGIAAMVTAFLDRSEEPGCGRDDFESKIIQELSCEVPGQSVSRLWNTSLFVLPHSKNLKWLTRLSQRGFSVSTGSACSAGRGNPSRVMAAMGLDFEAMGRVLRVSGSRDNSIPDWEALADALIEIDGELRG